MKLDEAGVIRWRFRCVYEEKRKAGFVRYSPSSARWKNVHAKVEHVVGVGRQSIVRQGKYIENADRGSRIRGKEDLVGKIGEPIEFARAISREHEYYKVMLAPRRGDLLDMEEFVRNAVKDVEAQIGVKIDYAAGIHRPKEPNSAGVHNLHAHLIVKGGYGRGANWLKIPFREAGAREATRQMEQGIGPRGIEREIARDIDMHLTGRLVRKHD